MTETPSSTKSRGDDSQNAQPEVLSTFSRNLQENTERSVLKETQDSAKNDEALNSCDARETRDSVGPDKMKPQRRGKGTENSKKQPKIAAEGQSNTGHKFSSKGKRHYH